jgi:hypothetical protein
MTTPLNKQVDDILAQLEGLTGEIRVQLHLAGMDVNDTWQKKYEPRLLDARRHAHEAKEASVAAIQETVQVFKAFQRTL